MRRTLVIALVVSLLVAAVLLPGISTPSAARHPPCKPPACNPNPGPTVSITNVVISNQNTLGGTTATVTWSTKPTGSCDTFAVLSLWKYMYPPCGTHKVDVTGLTPHVVYTFSITAQYTGYTSGYYSGSIWATTISQSDANEVFPLTYTASHPGNVCDGKTISYQVAATMPGDVEHNHATADPGSVTNSFFGAHFESSSVYCGNLVWNLKVRHIKMELFVYDMHHWFVAGNPWLGGLSMEPHDTSANLQGSIAWSINAGASYGPFNVGVSAAPQGGMSQLGPPYLPTKQTAVQADGSVLAGSIDAEWNPDQNGYGLDVVWHMHVFDTLAQSHYLDRIHFVVKFSITFADVGMFGYSGGAYDHLVTQTITLGDGYVPPNATAGSSDATTELQDGTQTITGFPGW